RSAISLVKMPSAASISSTLSRLHLARIHCGLPQLFGVPLTEALVALDLQALAAELLDHGRDLVPAPDRTRVAVLVLQRQRLGQRLLELGAGAAQLDDLRRADEVGVDHRGAPDAVHARAQGTGGCVQAPGMYIGDTATAAACITSSRCSS